MKIKFILYFLCLFPTFSLCATHFNGIIKTDNHQLANATVTLNGKITQTDSFGKFHFKDLQPDKYLLTVIDANEIAFEDSITVMDNTEITINVKPIANQMDEVVIKPHNNLSLYSDNPLPITYISSKQIDQTIGANLIDILVKNAPGLTALKTGPNISKPFIRGLGYNRVLTLYDGLRQEGQQWGDEHGIEIDAYNIKNAAVIKGPSSLMYGSDALAGVVSFSSYIPQNTDSQLHLRYTTEYQTNNNLIGNALRLGFNNGKILLGISGAYRMAKNYRNPIDGRVYATNFKEKNLAGTLGYQYNSGFIHLKATAYQNHQAIPDGSRDSASRKFTYQVYEGDKDNITERPIVPNDILNSYAIPDLAQKIAHYRLYLEGSQSFNSGNFNYLVGIQQNKRSEYNHPTQPKQPGMNVRLNTFNYSFKYNNTQINNLRLSVGFNGMMQQNKNENATNFPIPNYKLFDAGLFIMGSWQYQKWNITGGIRHDIRHVHWSNFYTNTNPITGFDEHITNSDTLNAYLQYPSFSKTFNGTAASIGFTFQINNQSGLKFNVGKAFRTPNITELASNGLDPGAHIIYLGNRNFNPESSTQADFGYEGNYANWDINTSIFFNNINNFIYLSMKADANGNPIQDAQGNKTYQYQQSAAHIYGAELSVNLHPSFLKELSFQNNFSLVYGYNNQYKNEGVNGAYLPLMPPFKWNSNLTKTFSWNKTKISPQIMCQYSAAQNRYLALNNTETATPSYTLWDLGINVALPFNNSKTLEIQCTASNIFNKAYQSNLSRLKYFEYYSASPNGKSGIYNMGRNVGVKAIYQF